MDERRFLSPDFSLLDDRPLSWRHYISPIDREHWEEYPKEIKRTIYQIAMNMMVRDINWLDSGAEE